MKKEFSQFTKDKKITLRDVPIISRLFKDSIKYNLNRKFGRPKVLPKYARISITNLCDSRCKMCHIWAYYKKHPEKLKDEMTLKEFKKFLDRNPFLQDIGLTGGQVTLREDILDMWLYMDKKGYRTGGATNAVDLNRVIKINEQALKRLSGKQKHLILVSLEGFEKYNDSLRGIKGGFKNSMKLLEWALGKQKDYPFLDVSVSHTITPENYKELLKFIDFLVDKGIPPKKISFRPAILLSRYDNLSSQQSGLKAAKEIIKVVKKVQKKYPEYNNYFVDGILEYLRNPKKQVVPCYAASSFFILDPYWNVYECMDMRHKLMNLRDTDFRLEPLWNRNKIQQVRKKIAKGQCSNCWNPCHAGPSMVSGPENLMKLARYELTKKRHI